MPSQIDKLKERITELERENEILKENAAFRPIFENAPLGIFRTSLDGRFLKANQTLCDMLGYENVDHLLSEVKDIRTQVYAYAEDRPKIINQLRENSDYARFEIDFKRRDGETFTGLISAKLIKDEKGRPKYFEGTAEDISEFIRAEVERRQSKNLYQTLVNTISDTIVISDLNGNIEYASQSAYKIPGYDADESVVGKNILDWLDKRNQQKAKENIYKIVNNLPHRLEEYEINRRDGTHFYAEIRTTVLPDEKKSEPKKLIFLIQDISFRKKTEEILRETQNLYRTIIELSPEGIMITHDGEILFLNTAMTNILDTDNPWEMVGGQFGRVVKNKYQKDAKRILTSTEGERSPKQVSIQIESLKKETKEVLISASPIVYDGKQCVFLFVSDITERVNAERQLKREKQFMDAFWEHVPDSITFKNKKGQYFRINDEFLKWVGEKKKENVLGKSDKELFGHKHFLKAKAEEKNVMEKGQLIINDVREEVWPNNQRKWVMLTKMPLYDVDQNIVGIFSITRDITREKESEIEIREREEWFRYIFDNSPVGKIITDDQFRIKSFNKSAKVLLGFVGKEILGSQIFKFFDGEDGKKLKEKCRFALKRKGASFQSEFILKTNYEDRHVIVQGVKITNQSKTQGEYLIHLIDIHSRKIAEDQLLVRNTELNNFVYKVSHDLKAPLTSIKGLINLMKLENDPEVFFQYVQMISGRVDRLDVFIRDVLSHSKNLNVEVKIEKVEIGHIIEECISQISFSPVFKHIKKEVKVSGVALYSDPHRLHEIMRNLISNAFQYSRTDIANPFVKINVRSTKKNCKIIIEDNGMGIKKKYQSRIFDMFYRANEKVEGSGIGLYIVKQSVEKLNGQITFFSTLKKGTRFELTVPNRWP